MGPRLLKARTFWVPLVLSFIVALACAETATPAPPATQQSSATPAPGPTQGIAATATPTSAPSPVPTGPGAGGQPKVSKLVMGLDPAAGETNLVWAGSVDHHQQMDLVMEALIDIDPETNNIDVPELADRWEMSPDGKAWTFWLHEGVPFHGDWGEFTARDVAHSVAMLTQESSLLGYVSAFRQIDRVEVHDDYQVTLHLKIVDPDFLFYVAPSGGMLIQSKAFWDARGLEGYQNDMIGTGPYRYTGRQLGVNVTYERLPDHWRVNNPAPDWQEFEIRWIKEPATRNAALLAKELHITELPRELTDAAVQDHGMKIVQSRHPSNQIVGVFGGLWTTLPDKFDPTLPYTDKKVRQAMSKALDKDAIAATLFSNRVTISPGGYGYYSNLPGWNPEWLERYDEMYGYDPEGARQLLREAGYEDGFQIKGAIISWFGFPEGVDLIQAMQLYYQDVGIDMQLEEWEFARWLAALRNKEPAARSIWIVPNSYATVSSRLRLFYYTEGGPTSGLNNEWLDSKFEELGRTADAAERDRIQREIGDYAFEEFSLIPLFYYFIEFTVDSEIVADWPFPGSDGANYGHLDLIRACTTAGPCR